MKVVHKKLLCMQALLFGATHPRATLHALSWRLSLTGFVILDDTVPVWRECDQRLLLLVQRAPSQRDLGNISSFKYLALLADRYNGGDCREVGGRIQPDMRSQLDASSSRLQSVIENRRSQFAPDDVSVLLHLSHLQWSKLLEQERMAQLECEHWRARYSKANKELDNRNKRIAELEAEVQQLKRRKNGESGTAASAGA